jgi:hypothetical protein
MNINSRKYDLYNTLSRFLKVFVKLQGSDLQLEGGWHGNQTVWRMTLDLNSILLYGDRSGTMHDAKQRTVYTLTDAIIAGDTDGPLNVEPVRLGAVTFGSSSAFTDLVNARLMQFDDKKIHTIREAFRMKHFKLTSHLPDECVAVLDGHPVPLDDLAEKAGKHFRPSAGWAGHIEL